MKPANSLFLSRPVAALGIYLSPYKLKPWQRRVSAALYPVWKGLFPCLTRTQHFFLIFSPAYRKVRVLGISQRKKYHELYTRISPSYLRLNIIRSTKYLVRPFTLTLRKILPYGPALLNRRIRSQLHKTNRSLRHSGYLTLEL